MAEEQPTSRKKKKKSGGAAFFPRIRRRFYASFKQTEPTSIFPSSSSLYPYIPPLPRLNESKIRSKTQIFRRRTQEHQEHSIFKIKPLFLYDSEPQIQHIIYQNDEKNTLYNMASSNQSNNIVCRNSKLKSYKFEFSKTNKKLPVKSARL